jgi:hypothetical protein
LESEPSAEIEAMITPRANHKNTVYDYSILAIHHR